jgi:predicted phosphodiesterase
MAHTAVAEIVNGPYIQRPSETEITVMWVTDTPGKGEVAYGEKDFDKTVSVEPGEPVTHEKGFKDKTLVKSYFYKVRLKELKPGTTYRYRVQAAGAESAASAFSTVPPKVGAFTFIAYGDSRLWGDTVHVVHQKIGAQFDRHQPAFILHCGDFVCSGNRHCEWKTMYFDPLKNVINHIPLWPVTGNHELECDKGTSSAYSQYFDFPESGRYYSFDYGNAHFVMLDEAGSPKMLKWCEDDLAAAKATWKIAVYHAPSYDLGKNLSGAMRSYLPIFRKCGLDLVFCGHTHNYQRFFPLRLSGDAKSKPITHIVTAGGGAGLYGVPSGHSYLAASAEAYHYLALTIDGNKLSAKVINIDGKTIDEFAITQEGEGYDKEYMALVKPEEPIQAEQYLRTCRMRGNLAPAKGATSDLRIEVPEYGPPSDIGGDLKITFRVASQSAENYRMDPEAVETVFKKGDRWISGVKLKLTALNELKMRERRPVPELFLEIGYETGELKGRFTAKPLYWIDNKEE